MKKAFSILALLLAATVPARAYAFAAPVLTQEIRTTNKDIPAPLAQYLTQYNSRYEEQFLSQVLQPLRQTKSKNSIEAADIEKEKEQSQRRTRNFAGEQVMRHDRDFDGKVSLSEIRESLLAVRHDGGFYDENFDAQNAARVKTQADELMRRFDADKDGIITLKEAGEGGNIKPRSRSSARRKSQLAQLLELDPDKDGKLTAAELTAIAKKAFRAADADGDGMLSRKETEKVRQAVVFEEVYGEGCSAPAPAKNDRIVVLSVDGGGMISPLGVSGQRRREAAVVRVKVEKGDTPLYITVASQNHVIWQLTGDTGRISRLLVYGPTDNDTSGKVMAGATGLPTAKVSFLKRADVDDEMGGYVQCLPPIFSILRPYYGSKQRIMIQKQLDDAITRILGRKPDVMGSFAAPFQVNIGDGEPVVAAVPDKEQPAPETTDAETWKDFITIYPGGVATIKKEDVVTEQDLEPRNLLPGLAGVAQLVKSGHLVREKDSSGSTLVVVTGGGQLPVVIRTTGIPMVVEDSEANRQVRLFGDHIYRVAKKIEEYPRSYGGYTVRYLMGVDMEAPKDRQLGCFIKDGEEDNCR